MPRLEVGGAPLEQYLRDSLARLQEQLGAGVKVPMRHVNGKRVPRCDVTADADLSAPNPALGDVTAVVGMPGMPVVCAQVWVLLCGLRGEDGGAVTRDALETRVEAVLRCPRGVAEELARLFAVARRMSAGMTPFLADAPPDETAAERKAAIAYDAKLPRQTLSDVHSGMAFALLAMVEEDEDEDGDVETECGSGSDDEGTVGSDDNVVTESEEEQEQENGSLDLAPEDDDMDADGSGSGDPGFGSKMMRAVLGVELTPEYLQAPRPEFHAQAELGEIRLQADQAAADGGAAGAAGLAGLAGLAARRNAHRAIPFAKMARGIAKAHGAQVDDRALGVLYDASVQLLARTFVRAADHKRRRLGEDEQEGEGEGEEQEREDGKSYSDSDSDGDVPDDALMADDVRAALPDDIRRPLDRIDGTVQLLGGLGQRIDEAGDAGDVEALTALLEEVRSVNQGSPYVVPEKKGSPDAVMPPSYEAEWVMLRERMLARAEAELAVLKKWAP